MSVNISSKKFICLVGLMGCGKSSIGKLLSEKLQLPFYDSDKEIEKLIDKSISDFFREKTESEFRTIEKTIILNLLNHPNGIISIGGGAFIDDDLRFSLLEKCYCVYLKTKPETCYEHVKHSTNRPLLNDVDVLKTLKNLFSEREKFYLKSDKIITIDGLTLDQVFEETLRSLSIFK